ncbi:unnamed protein product [Chironomus riparius]|uniref:Peptidase S1 domain-containing protein n=1 Tax=Chironomus riparius TaxID=315576 RepID=A0A9N9S3P3_9DIPT|nr:unnamed protein product [Chironomus riparius]
MRTFIFAFVIHISIFGSINSQYQFNNQFQLNPYNIFGQFGYNQQNQRPTTQQIYRPNNQQNIYYPQSNLYYPQNTQTNRPPVQTSPHPKLRLSETKCSEYLKKAQNSVLVGSLSLIPNIQGIQTDNCDASQGLIIGGENAKAGEFPHMAAIGYKNLDNIVNFKCGGSLISEQFVLTAAHCRTAGREKPSVVRLGDLNLKIREQNSPEKDVAIASFISHEKYDPNKSKNDIAVVKLVSKVTLSKDIRPACLMVPTNTANIQKAIAIGFGLTEAFTDHTSDIMQKVELPVKDLQSCRRLLDDQTIDESQICAGDSGKDTCQGDSGGPLQIVSTKNKCVYIIIGITSFGNTFCGAEDSPGVYTRVSYYLDWIEQKVWGSG